MRILFLHDNFPAQFGAFGQYLAQGGWDVLYGTQREAPPLKGIKTFRYKPHREVSEKIHPYTANLEKAVLAGQAVARASVDLRDQGYAPDLVMAHSGWGPGMFVKDVWPDAAYVGYFEWYYNKFAPDVAFLNDGDRPLDDDLRGRMRNAAILTDLAACEVGICPTRFQKLQFPACFDGKLTVMHDGVDTERYAPEDGAKLVLPSLDLSHAEEIVTYVARGMEPYRGFPEFMEAAAQVLAARPNAHVVVVGEDRVAYGRKLSEGDSFKKRALETFDYDESRLHFVGLLSRGDYRKVLLASSVHVYLTIPFVLSWSMMEAMSAGCALVASDTEPVRELLDETSAALVDMKKPADVSAAIVGLLEDKGARDRLGAAARARIVADYAMRDIFPQKKKLLTRLVV